MSARRKNLEELLEKIKGLPALVVGDVMLDRYIWGSVDRISAEAPVPVVRVRRTEERLGGAGNVVHNLRNIGVNVALFGYVGNDEEGAKVLSLLKELGINNDGVMVDSTRPTTLKTRVIAHHQQVVRIDREEPPSEELPLDDRLDEKFSRFLADRLTEYKVIIVSDYAKGVISERVMNALQSFRDKGKISLTSRPLVVDPHPSNLHLYKSMSVGKPNRKEAESASGVRIKDNESAIKAAKILLEKWKSEMMLISLGEDGLLIADSSGAPEIILPTEAREVSDVSGAGDTVTAVFAAGLGAGATPSIAGDLANVAAGVVVSEVGTTPVYLFKLKREIEKL